jgi:hypothetical protein
VFALPLTQLGGLLCVRDGATLYEYRDNGICGARRTGRTRRTDIPTERRSLTLTLITPLTLFQP